MQAVILMYGYIGEYEAIDDAAFVSDLQELSSRFPEILIRVNCGGGDVYKGMTIYNTIKENNDKIKIKIDGIAASMGAIFPLGAKKENVSISKYGRMMTHRVSSLCFGNADEMRAQATELEAWEVNIADILAERTGLSKEDAKKKYIVSNDRWISGQQAKDEGLVGEVYDADPVSVPDNKNEQELFNSYNVVLNKAKPQSKKYTMKKELLKKLNLSEDATDDQIDNAVQQLLIDKETTDNTAKAVLKNKAKTLLDKAITNRLITEEERPEYQAKAEESEDGYAFVEKVIAKMQPIKKPTELLNRKDSGAVDGNKDESVSEWEALLKKGPEAVAAFKNENRNEYIKIWEAHFKVPFPEQR